MMKKYLFPFAVMAAVLTGCGSSEEESGTVVPEKKVMIVEARDCAVDFEYPAQLKGKQDIAIVPQVSATLEQLLVVEGQTVKKGEKMFVLNQTEFRSVLENAQAQVKNAEAQVSTDQLEVDAQKVLLDKNIISDHQYKVACNNLLMSKARLAEAKAAVAHASNDLSHTVLVAPFDGVVGDINYRLGSLVGPSMEKPITVVSDNSVIYAYTSINEMDYLALVHSAGTKENLIQHIPDCKLKLSDDVLYSEIGKVETISGVIDRETGAVSMRTAFPNGNGTLSSGGTGTLIITVPYHAMVIPRSATFETQDKTFVYKVVKNDSQFTVESTEVKVYRLNELEYIVLDGLNAGMLIVTDGVRKMVNGMAIEPEFKDSTIVLTDSLKNFIISGYDTTKVSSEDSIRAKQNQFLE